MSNQTPYVAIRKSRIAPDRLQPAVASLVTGLANAHDVHRMPAMHVVAEANAQDALYMLGKKPCGCCVAGGIFEERRPFEGFQFAAECIKDGLTVTVVSGRPVNLFQSCESHRVTARI